MTRCAQYNNNYDYNLLIMLTTMLIIVIEKCDIDIIVKIDYSSQLRKRAINWGLNNNNNNIINNINEIDSLLINQIDATDIDDSDDWDNIDINNN